MNKVYFVMRSKGFGHEMYYCRGHNGLGISWTFKIAEALWWKTDRMPNMIAGDSTEISVVEITKNDYFKRVLQGK